MLKTFSEKALMKKKKLNLTIEISMKKKEKNSAKIGLILSTRHKLLNSMKKITLYWSTPDSLKAKKMKLFRPEISLNL